MKRLFLRLDESLYTLAQLQKIKNFFNSFFLSTYFLNIAEQKKQIQKLIDDNPDSIVVSMDKFIPTSHNIDASRVYDLHTAKYLYHNIKFNGKLARNQKVILYDHDKVGGLGIKLVTALLEVAGNSVTEHVLVSLDKGQAKTWEILDFADFIDSGLVCQISEGILKRVPYNHTDLILNSRASIPLEAYSRFNEGMKELLEFITND